MTKYILVLTATLFSLAITAQEPVEDFHPLDVDQDGLISIQEAESDAFLTEYFAKLDVNADGYLSKEELEAEIKTDE